MRDFDEVVLVDDLLFMLASSGKGGKEFESDSAGIDPREKLAVLEARLAMARDSDLAREVLLGAQSALQKAGDPKARFTLREVLGLEAVVDTVERPSLSLHEGVPNLASTMAEKLFGFKLHQMEDRISAVAAAIGRISTLSGSLVGTAIHIGEGRVATNRHVLEAIAVPGSGRTWALKWPGETKIDFAAELGIPSTPRFKVVGVHFCGPNPINEMINFTNLDLAVLDIEPIDGADLPPAVELSDDAEMLKTGRWIYALGFPGRPKIWNGAAEPMVGHENAVVMRDLFDDEFDCKKLAPGKVLSAPGTVPSGPFYASHDPNRWAFAHDCSTLRGNSGSALVEFQADGGRVLGIHFGGFTRSRNFGHAFGPLKADMEELGATYF